MNEMLFSTLRYGFAAALMVLALPGCAQSKTQRVNEEIARASVRFNDAPPVVDSNKRYHLPVDTRPALAGTDYIHFTPRGAEQISQILYDTFLLYYKFYCFRKNES